MSPQTSAAQIITDLLTYGRDLAQTLIPIGLGLTLALFTIKIAWEGLQIAVGSRSVNDGIANILLTAAIGATVAMLFVPGGGGLYSNFIDIIDGGFNAIARALTGTGGYDTSQLTSLTTPLFRVVTKMWGAVNSVMAQETWNPLTALVVIAQSLFLLMFTVFYMVIFGVALVTFMSASIVFAIGVAFGPVLIPWVLFKPLEAAMDRWFWFVVTAGFQKIMILVILLMGAKATEKILGDVMTTIEISAKKGEVFMTPDPFLVLFIVGVLLLMLILKSEAITNALLPGHGAVGIAGILRGAAAVGRGASGLAKGGVAAGTATAKGAAALATGVKNTAQFGNQVSSAAAKLSAATGMSTARATVVTAARKIADSGAAYQVGNVAGRGVGAVKAWNANPFKNYKAHGSASPTTSPPSPTPSAPGNAAREKLAAVKAQTRSRR
jgi:hypothetical protein